MAESQNIEWKESWRDEYLKWICGFANAQGGKIYIGTRDDGTVIGLIMFQYRYALKMTPCMLAIVVCCLLAGRLKHF